MKSFLKRLLQKILGFDRYLFIFSIFKIRTFKWDKNEKDFFHFLNLMKKDSHVLDIGSNIGITTVLLSKKVPQGKVYSFEPVPPNYKTLTKIVNYFKCKNVQLFQMALGNEEGEVEMVMPEVENVKMQGLSHVVHESLTEFNEGKIYKAPLKKLDQLTDWKGHRIEGIKIDVENFEYFVLQGGEAMLKKDRPIVYAELWDNKNRSQCFELMTSLGFQIKILQKNQLIAFDSTKHETQNFFFVP